jgi:hypothetical protein
MRKSFRLTCGVAALVLAGCSVQVQNKTPDKFQANPDIGMYPIKATVTAGAMVSQPIYLYDVGSGQKIPLKSDPTGTHWSAMLPVHCQSSFKLQYLAIWRLQGLATKQKLFPPQPIVVKLTPPPLIQEATIDTSGAPKKGVWEGGVDYKFGTARNTQITGASIEPLGKTPADVRAAKQIRIVSTFPINAECDKSTAITLASSVRQAQAKLVIHTSLPGKMAKWSTKVTFQPKPSA